MGRKSLKDESLMADVINYSWTTIKRMLSSPNVDDKTKGQISLEIVKKSCPRDINLGGQEGNPIKVFIEIDGNTNQITP